MACTSGSVRSVADKTVAAKIQVDKLQASIAAQETANRQLFYNSITTHLLDADVADAREIQYGSDVKTEYTSEFSLDKIASVVVSALKAIIASQGVNFKTPAMGAEALSAYSDVVNAVAEAAKSSSVASANLSFSMTRLSPGLLVFLYAVSTSIKDADTFGTEAVTTTAIYYRFMQSIQDIKNDATWGEAVIDARNLLNMKALQAALTDDLAFQKINIEEWNKKDDAYSAAVKKIEERLDAHNFDKKKDFVLNRKAMFGPSLVHSFGEGSRFNQEIINSAIDKLKLMGSAYDGVVEKSRARLSKAYF